jgi:hypothetical protein
MLRPWVEPAPVSAPAPFALLPDDELETPALPREHPRWVKDAIAVSLRARRLFAALRPPAIRVLSFWDHQTRAISVGGRALGIDSSGSYYAVQ